MSKVELASGSEVYVTRYALKRTRVHLTKAAVKPCGDHCDGFHHWTFENEDGENAGKAEFYMIPQRDLDAIERAENATRAESGKPVHDAAGGRA